MACSGIRTTPQKASKAAPVIGEIGLLLIEYVGEDAPETVYGEVTNKMYPFDENRTRYVDMRDAAYLLGRDFVEA